MKITNFLRFLLIAVAAVMVFSLFACVEEPETETTTEEIENTTESSDDKKPEDSEKDTDDSESTPVGGDTESSTESVSDEESSSEEESTSETEPGCQHVEETLAGKAATCTEAGLTDGKKCSVCGEILVEQEVIPAGHTEETIAGKAATCTETGLTDGKKCSVCDEVLVEQEEIAALGHNKVDKTFTAPTTAEDGWEAHKYCEACGTAWSTEDEELDAVPAIAKIVPATNKYWGYEDMKGVTVNANVSTKPSDDRSYVRFERTGECEDVFYLFMEGNTEVTGRYFVYKYRTDHTTNGEFWSNTTENGHSNGAANIFAQFVDDEQWHVVVYDLATSISKFVQPSEDGTYTIQWARIDMLNAKASEGYFDIAYMAFCDDLSEVASIMQDGDTDLCPHFTSEDPVYVNEGDKHSTDCQICGIKMYGAHYAANGTTWNPEKMAYTGTCVCGIDVESDMIYKTESNKEVSASSQGNYITVSQEDGFIRYTASKDATDPYFYPYRYGNAVTGQYMVIKYRLVNNGQDAAISAPFASSVAFGRSGAAGNTGDASNRVYGSVLYGDGEWHYLVVTPDLTNNLTFTPNEDGTYSWAYLRLTVKFAAYDGSCYIDIDEIAFADNVDAAEYYAYTKDPKVPFRYNYDKDNNLIDGTSFLNESVQNDGCFTLDMSTCAALTTPTSLTLGGWTCTPGGNAGYYIRVTKVDGEAVADPQLVSWSTAAKRGDIYTAVGAPKGYSEACANGAGFDKAVVDFTAYAGKTIDFELVAVTNYGVTVVFSIFTNLAVPATT